MANHALSRPEGAVDRRDPTPHDLWLPDHLTGSLVLALETPPGQLVSPGTGQLSLTEDSAGEVVAQKAARLAGEPVLPGSGIKGAVRTLFELLSFSCDPFAGRSDGERCTKSSCCEACALFGLLGWSGRVSFGDASPASPGAVEVKVEKVPIPWLPHADKTRGEFRVYDLGKAVQFDPDRRVWEARPKELTREVFSGRFETRLTFWNLSREQLGRLMLCMGIGEDSSTRFLLRLGGVKYDGKGGVEVSPQELCLATPERSTLSGDRCKDAVTGWIDAAHKSDWGATFWPELEKVAKVLTMERM
jgi:RAMP superfamily protein